MARAPASPPLHSPAARLQALRERGAERADPVQFAFLNAVALRLDAQTDDARAPLEARLAARIDALQAVLDGTAHANPNANAALGAGAAGVTPSALAALAALTARLAQSVHERGEAALPAPPGAGLAARPEPAALADVRRIWARLNAGQRLTQSLAAVPDNAGPLNSQHLVHRALVRLHALSPGYLHRFMAYVDALAALEEMQAGAAPPPAAAARPEAARKPARSSARGARRNPG